MPGSAREPLPELVRGDYAVVKPFAIIFPLLAIGLLVFDPHNFPPLYVVVTLIAAPFLWRWGDVRVRTSKEGIEFVNFAHRYRLRWNQISGVDAELGDKKRLGEVWKTYLFLDDGRKIRCEACASPRDVQLLTDLFAERRPRHEG